MEFLSNLIDREAVRCLVFSGRGGKEMECLRLISGAKRAHHALFDGVLMHEGREYKIEIKRQRNLQWFDLPKYAALTEEEREIIILFVLHNKTGVDEIAWTSLGAFIDTLCNDPVVQKDGWTREALVAAGVIRKTYPTLQFKARLQIRACIKRHASIFHTYKKDPSM